MVKVNITFRNAKIEVEGSPNEVKDVLSNYWSPLIQFESELQTDPGGEENSHKGTAVKKSPRKKTPKSNISGNKPDEIAKINEQDIANKIKTHKSADKIRVKILDIEKDWLNKCKLVAYMVDGTITSGTVYRVLKALKIRSSLPTLSTTLSKNNSEFLVTGSSTKLYELTASSKAKFLDFLNSDNESN